MTLQAGIRADIGAVFWAEIILLTCHAGRPRKAVAVVKQEATAEPVDKSAEEEARQRQKTEAAQKRAEAKEAALRMAKAAEDKKRAEEAKKAAAEESRTRKESEKSRTLSGASASARAAAAGEVYRCTLCGGQAGSASEYQIHLFGRHELLW